MNRPFKRKYRLGLPGMPPQIRELPVDERGYPIPWFVAMVDGKPDFRVADGAKVVRAVTEKLCWVCGKPITSPTFTFVIGPMCAINRISAEPPTHFWCAEFSVKACPFLTMPRARRRDANLPEGMADPAGVMLDRNPGVSMVWVTDTYRLIRDGSGYLFQMGDPMDVAFYREGRKAVRSEIEESIRTGLPALQSIAEQEGEAAERALVVATTNAMTMLQPFLPRKAGSK